MTIAKRTINRKITEQEFIRLRKGDVEPFATYRQESKEFNFGILFGMSYKKFSQAVLEIKWGLERALQFIVDKGLEADVDVMKDRYPDIEPKLWSYYACAQYIRNNFFETYKGLMKRIKRNEEYGKTIGYVRSVAGTIRRFPLLSLATNEEGKWRKDENIKEMAGEVNTCANTDIQSLEVFTIAPAMLNWYHNKNYEKAYFIGTVHDSVDMLVLKEGALQTLEELKEIFEQEYEWQKGIKMPVDFVIVDFNNPKHYMKHGWSLKEFKALQTSKKEAL